MSNKRPIRYVIFPEMTDMEGEDFRTRQVHSGRWIVRTVGGNGETEDVSQAYNGKTSAAALRGARKAALRKAKRLGSGVPWQVEVDATSLSGAEEVETQENAPADVNVITDLEERSTESPSGLVNPTGIVTPTRPSTTPTLRP